MTFKTGEPFCEGNEVLKEGSHHAKLHDEKFRLVEALKRISKNLGGGSKGEFEINEALKSVKDLIK